MDETLEQARQYFLRGIAHFDAQRFDSARVCFESALRLTPGRPSVLGNLGITLFRMGLFEDAIPVLQRTVEADAEHTEAWVSLGLCQEAIGRWATAADSLTRGLALEPRQPRVWLVCSQCRMRAGAMASALDACDRAIELDPGLPEAWTARGDLLRLLHRAGEAAECFERAIALGADTELNRFYLASVRQGDSHPRSPRQYVEALFDEYAADFQAHLVEKLRYRAYEHLLRPFLQAGRRYGRVIDLGCGTGLCGVLLRGVADGIEGVDLSAAMLEEARRTAAYGNLVHADLATYLTSAAPGADLVLAADVFVYVGELGQVFAQVRRILGNAGRFAFTLERAQDGREVSLLPSLRYAHSESYVRRLAQEHGFAVDEIAHGPIREDGLQPIPGLYVYLS